MNGPSGTDFSIRELLESYGADSLPTRGAGWIRCRCCFHGEDSTPSAAFNESLQAFVCHSCGVSGDTIKIVREREGIGYRDAVKYLESVVGSSTRALPVKHHDSYRPLFTRQGN